MITKTMSDAEILHGTATLIDSRSLRQMLGARFAAEHAGILRRIAKRLEEIDAPKWTLNGWAPARPTCDDPIPFG